MNRKISRTEFSESMDRHLSAVKADPWLAQRIIAAEGGEKPVARKWSASIVLAIALVAVLATGALAATLGAWGIIDFAGRYSDTYIPPKYEDCIKPENVKAETEHLACTIRESYYDGTILRVTADVVPKEKMLLVGEGFTPDFPFAALFPDSGPEDMTVAEAAQAFYENCMAEVILSPVNGADSSNQCLLNSDGSVTLYEEYCFGSDLPDRDVTFRLMYRPVAADEGDYAQYDPSKLEGVDIPMSFHAVETKTFVCDTPLDFPSVGVQVIGVSLTVTPVEIRALIDYTVTDKALFAAQKSSLWFEFVDPESTAADAWEQRVTGGLNGIAMTVVQGGIQGRSGAVYRLRDSIGLDALGSEYTLRAYNPEEDTRYESVTFTVKEAE